MQVRKAGLLLTVLPRMVSEQKMRKKFMCFTARSILRPGEAKRLHQTTHKERGTNWLLPPFDLQSLGKAVIK
jgi:hypothetical protein